MKRLLRAVRLGINKLAGSFSWTPPPWAAALQRTRKQSPKRFWSGLGLLALLAFAVVAGYGYYRHLPRPLLLTADIEAPGITPNDETLQPDALRVSFRYNTQRLQPEQQIPEIMPSVARLDLVDQRIETGIRLKPAISGTWSWEGDRTLIFVPDREWQAGTRYRLRFDKQLFSPESRFSSLDYTFDTPAFDVDLDNLEFYQDPRNRKIRQAVATLRFSHPVDAQSLEKHLALSMHPSDKDSKASPQKVGFTLSYDKNQREAYVHSMPLQLPEHSNYLRLSLQAGIAPAIGGEPSTRQLAKELLIPDRLSFLKVEEAEAIIVRTSTNEPQQVLRLRFTDDITEAELKDKLQAWLLPPRNPQRNSSRWRSPREVTSAILAQATPVPLVPLETEHGFSREFHLPLDAPPGGTLYLRLKPGLTSLGGFVHASFYDTLLRAPTYPKELQIAADGALLSLAGSHRLGLMTRGLDAFQVRIGKLLPGQLQHLISQTYGDLSDPDFASYRFDEDNIVEYAQQIIDLKQLPPQQANYASVDLSAYLPSDRDRCGLFFVELCGWDKTRKRKMSWVSDKRLILVTDFGLLVKDNADRSHDVFVRSFGNGQPVAGARVTLQGRNGLPLLTRTTDAEGHVKFPSTKGFRNEQQPTAYVVTTADDMAFIPFERRTRQLNFSRFEVGGVRDRQRNGQSLGAFLFSDRGLYRPGEQVAIGCIVKAQPLNNIEGIPLEIAIRNPRGTEVASKRLKLPAKGFFDYPYATQAASETGTYQVALYLVRDNNHRGRMIGLDQFRVEEFQPDTLKIRSTLLGIEERGWSTATRLTARVGLRNLFGTPAQGRKVTAFMNVRSARFSFKEYPEFSFADPWYDPDKQPLQISEELNVQTTDEQGQAEFTLPLERFNAGTYLLTLTTEGFEPGGGRSVTARNSVLLSPLKTLIGTKSDGKLDYIHKDAERVIDLLAIGTDLQPRAVEGLRARLAEIRSISTLVQQPDGTYAYQSMEKEQELHIQDFAIDASGSRYRLPTDRPGTYVWEILDAQGLKLARVRFTVVGHGNLLGQREKNAELDLKLDRNDYKAGDTIEMNITAPYTGSGLITIESHRVHTWKWFSADTTSSMQTITIPKDLEGNAYVNVAFVRAADSREIFTSPLSYAVAPFTIDRGKRTLDVQLDVASKARPGDRMEINYSTSRPSRIAVFAVNEGILQVAKYKTPQPLDHFLRKRALQVDTLQMLDLLLPEFDLIRRLSASGGGMADESMRKALAANLNPFARALDKPAVFWSGILDADSQKRSVSFTVPDTFAGTLRIMAVAVAEEAIGVAEESSLVRGPFVITPSLPTQAAPGDSFRTSASISNILEGSGKNAPVSVRLEASEQLDIIGDKEQRLTISEGSEKTLHFQLRAKDKLGAAQVRFIVTSGKEQATRRATLSIRPALPYTTTLSSGYSKNGKAQLKVPRSLYADLAEQRVAASSSPLVLIDGLSSYLEHFPHGCTEQVVSQVFPLVGLMSHPAFAPHSKDNRQRFATLIARLRERQLANGGFCFWPGGSEVAEFPSVYVMHFLLEVRALGYAVPEDLMTRGRDYLRDYVGNQPADLEQARVRAYAIYLLTRMGEVTTNHLINLQTWLDKHQPKIWRQDLAAAYMASAYGLLHMQDDARALISHYPLGAKDSGKDGIFHSALTRDAQFVYLLAKHFPNRAAKLDGEALLRFVEPVFRGRYNTISAAYTILALGAYGQLQTSPLREEAIRITAVDRNKGEHPLAIEQQPLPQAAFGTDTAKLLVAADKALFHLLSQAGFDREMPTTPVRDKLEITREYLNGNGKPVTELQQGQEVTVRLRVRALNEPVSNVAVIDLLPGGFEVLRDSVPRTAVGWRADYVDVREDRVVFYGRFDTTARELSYRAKVTSAGQFVIPPPFAEAMYDRAVRASGVSGTFNVTPSDSGGS
ncbi:alpha-2-macroglobulin domain protein [Syntrophotalea carbinolica DSM 2380]|uniref:Alpha-2-macroglobulin domain protein n=1 Tax=Syntrophotalea carbinolica (strain DSM 2380 / NBRC 103641 / GraBd1) TaxID=338963 RepID=Q3A743_SYNC1|nr:alpha-2-macroglobulin [Syntrophotalea carbinolica]ABA87804.1 alpha-2-macroglobulin domain protein [Syntrophotalea carbinolica DSM 2380]